MKYAWAARHKKHWPVSLACDVLDVSTSGFFENMRRTVAEQPSVAGANKRISNEALLAQIRAIHAEVKQEYGWPKMWKKLAAHDKAEVSRINDWLRATSKRSRSLLMERPP